LKPTKRIPAATTPTRRPPTGAKHPAALLRRFAPALIVLFIGLVALPAFGQDISIDFGDDATLTERAIQLIGIITILSDSIHSDGIGQARFACPSPKGAAQSGRALSLSSGASGC
jgi:hypothetical protein